MYVRCNNCQNLSTLTIPMSQGMQFTAVNYRESPIADPTTIQMHYCLRLQTVVEKFLSRDCKSYFQVPRGKETR